MIFLWVRDDVKKLLFIATPHNTQLPYQYVVGLIHTWKDLFGKYDLAISLAESALVHKNRTKLFRNAYDDKADYLLFIDTDMVWTPGAIEQLIAFDRDVVSGLYLSRRPLQNIEHAPVVFQYTDGKMSVMKSVPDSPFRADAVGMGFCLIKRNVIEKMTGLIPKIGYPFDYIDISEVGAESDGLTNTLGEDMSFCYRLQKAEFNIWVLPQVRVGHLVTEMII